MSMETIGSPSSLTLLGGYAAMGTIQTISAGDAGWECCQALDSNAAVYHILNLGDPVHDSGDEPDDYEELDEGNSLKKQQPKAP
ncbi:hypothetical protein B0H10DRAFT_2213655 [Mycena sp. CBHHK59/15]|nr:hypothetical protein B0H10DRAFT_2213655 [Mycena sp. CBHHK59/15]